MNTISVLVIDDELYVLKAIASVLKQEGINVTCVQNSVDAFSHLDTKNYDLILLDIIMPEKDGFTLLKELRERNILTPVILLSGREEDSAQVEGLSLGADDYMIKPFSKSVLVSKIRAIIRRTQQYSNSDETQLRTVIKRGPFSLHLNSQTVLKNGNEISLSAKEFTLLCYFMENPDVILTKQEIFSNVWKSENSDDNSILVYIKRLRDKIEENPSSPRHLTTVWGKGYKFIP